MRGRIIAAPIGFDLDQADGCRHSADPRREKTSDEPGCDVESGPCDEIVHIGPLGSELATQRGAGRLEHRVGDHPAYRCNLLVGERPIQSPEPEVDGV